MTAQSSATLNSEADTIATDRAWDNLLLDLQLEPFCLSIDEIAEMTDRQISLLVNRCIEKNQAIEERIRSGGNPDFPRHPPKPAPRPSQSNPKFSDTAKQVDPDRESAEYRAAVERARDAADKKFFGDPKDLEDPNAPRFPGEKPELVDSAGKPVNPEVFMKQLIKAGLLSKKDYDRLLVEKREWIAKNVPGPSTGKEG